MGAPAVVSYFNWLVEQTGDRHASYMNLLKCLHQKPFEWYVHSDDNRVEDGKELREEYTEDLRIQGEDLWADGKASTLEVLLGLSRRLEYDTDIPACDWFWKLLENLDLKHYTDLYFTRFVYHAEEETDRILDTWIQRNYNADGSGGIFPLRMSTHDQCRVELWYQMQAYLLEGEHVANGP